MVDFVYFCEKLDLVGIPSYITELLDEHEYVTIPGFGAFVSVYCPARFVPSSKVIFPPSRRIEFRTDLKIDDGLLAGYVAYRKKLAHHQAQKMLQQFTDDLRYRLEKGEDVTLETLGVLSGTGSAVSFSREESTCPLPGVYGLSPVNHVLPEPDITEHPKVEANLPEGRIIHLRKRHLYAALPILAVICLIVWFAFFYHSGAEKSSVNNQLLQPVTSAVHDSLKEMAQLRSADSSTMVRDHQIAGNDPNGTTGKEEQTSTPSNETISKPASATSAAAISGFKPDRNLFYLIGGSFKSQENADDYFVRMTAKGENPLHLGKIGDFFLVAVGVYPSDQDAQAAAKLYKSNHPGADLYVYHPR